jgi:hypothetical protein
MRSSGSFLLLLFFFLYAPVLDRTGPVAASRTEDSCPGAPVASGRGACSPHTRRAPVPTCSGPLHPSVRRCPPAGSQEPRSRVSTTTCSEAPRQDDHASDQKFSGPGCSTIFIYLPIQRGKCIFSKVRSSVVDVEAHRKNTLF